MPVLFMLLTLLTGLTLPVLPLLLAFVPQVGLLALRAGHSRRVRGVQVGLIWVFALLEVLVPHHILNAVTPRASLPGLTGVDRRLDAQHRHYRAGYQR